MPNARVKPINITGVDNVDTLLKLDIATHENGGNVGYTQAGTVTPKSLDDTVVVQGIKGVVSKVGVTASRSSVGAIVSADIGNVNAKKFTGIIKPVDDATFKPYLMSDLVACVTKVTVIYKGYDLMLESYSFSGKTIDCLNDLAGLVYGTVRYDSSSDTYYVVGGDVSDTSSFKGFTYSVDVDDLISYEVTKEKNNQISSFSNDLIAVAKDIATLRATILDLPKDSTISTTTRELRDVINVDFGQKSGPKTIGPEFKVDSVDWDTWYLDADGHRYVGPSGDTKFESKFTGYFAIETITDLSTDVNSSGGTTTVTRGQQRGLRSLRAGTTLWYRIKNVYSYETVYGKGYLTNLHCTGLPSITKYNQDKQAAGGGNTPYDDCYHVLYDVEVKKVYVKESDGSSNILVEYVPFLGFTVDPGIYNKSYDAIKASYVAKGSSADPSESDIASAMLNLQYGATVEIMCTSSSTELKYKGTLDAHGRLISESGQVMLVLIDDYFYGPIEGMDMSFTTLTDVSINPTSYDPNVYIINSTLINDYFDETSIKTQLLAAWTDLKTLCKAQAPVGKYTTSTEGYPRFISEILTNPPAGATPRVIGVQYGTSSVLNAEKEATVPLTLTPHSTSNKKRRQLERKLKCLESKVSLLVKCINAAQSSNHVSIGTVRSVLKTIITYETILARVKNESLATIISLKASYEEALNKALLLFDNSKLASIYRVSLSAILPDSLPAIGDRVKLPVGSNKSYTITSVTTSGLTVNISGESHV